MNRRGRVIRVVAPALAALEMYRGTALLLAATGVVTLISLLPVTSLWIPGANSTRLAFSSVRGADLGMPWNPDARTPAAGQLTALTQLFRLLLGTAAAALAAAALTMLTLSAARASERAPELAIRRSVGASRRGVLASALLEAGLVAAVVLALGGAAGGVAAGLAGREWPGPLASGGPAMIPLSLALVCGALMLAGILPLVFARRTRLTQVEAQPLPLLVPAIQLGISLTILTAGALVARHAGSLLNSATLGSRDGEVYQVPVTNTSPSEEASRLEALLQRLSSDSQHSLISVSSPGTIAGLGTVAGITTDCGLCSFGGLMVPWHQVLATHEMVSADTFRALGVKMVAGRSIGAEDRWDAPRVAVVNRALAARHFQEGEAIGRQLMVGLKRSEWYTVVGIVDDPPPAGFGAALQPEYTVYLSVLQHPLPQIDLLVRHPSTPGASGGVASVIQDELGVPSGSIARQKEAELLAAEARPLRWFGRWFGVEGWIALIIGLTGTYALMRLWVRSLYAELGLRRAVGARGRSVIGYVVVRAALVSLVGAGTGMWFGPSLWNMLSGLVPGLPVWDWNLVLRFTALLTVTTVVGALEPALRVIRAKPAELLA
ncbi:MAG TPA: FtsX-like permease family protein [Gemmatimonadales bacterium]|nr:FtsX-like permease family protein [Gemmatimonadales bacterium]